MDTSMHVQYTVTQNSPLKLKTTSIPTMGKFFRVEDVNQDLLVELQDATMDKEFLSTHSHYILDQCDKLLPMTMKHIPQADANSPLTISSLKHRGEALYHNGHWEPTQVPKILRLPSPSAGSSQPRWSCSSAGTRCETVCRHIIRTSQEETIDGTFLPTAGSEEWQVMKWLNKITLAMHAFVPGSAGTEILGPTVTHHRVTCATTALHNMKHCRWFLETSCKLIKDGLMPWKPDMVLCEDSLGHTFRPQPELSWKDVISFMELMTGMYSLSNDVGTIRNAVMCKAYAVFTAQPATSCWHVCLNEEHYMVKDSWTSASWVSCEEDILHEIQGLKGVPELVAACTVKIGGSDDDMHLCHDFPFHIEDVRIHCRLVMWPVATPLSNFNSIHKLLSIFIDVLDVHMTLVMQYYILHHDLSDNNIMIYPCDVLTGKTMQHHKVAASSSEEWPCDGKCSQDDGRDSHMESHHNDAVDSITEETHEQKLIRWDQERCQQIWTGTLHNGLLINFDYATKLDQSQPQALTAGDHTISLGTIHQDKHVTQTMLKPWVSVANPTNAVNLGLHK
ncbi:hypothetical protein EDC04DRAFT_2609880 [Pisolithus marmoratus]|nr:hypothetical protein EDC04DRAFT_2609880 [Pisolithus marmoratus]